MDLMKGRQGVWLAVLLLLLGLPACPAASQPEQDLRQEIQGLKAEVAALKEKLAKLEAGQQMMLELLKKPAPMAMPTPAPILEQPASPQAPQPLTVSQLIAGKDQYVGTRVTVKGMVGPVLVHHKSLLLKAPEGMVEVFLNKLGDEKLVSRLTSATLEQPLTVTGVVAVPPKGGAKLQITAEAVEF